MVSVMVSVKLQESLVVSGFCTCVHTIHSAHAVHCCRYSHCLCCIQGHRKHTGDPILKTHPHSSTLTPDTHKKNPVWVCVFILVRTFDTHVEDKSHCSFNEDWKSLFCPWFPIWLQISVVYCNVSHLAHCAICECTSLSESVTWEAGLCPGGLCPHTTVNNVTPLLAYHDYPNSGLLLTAADLGHWSVSDEVIQLLYCSGRWQKYKGTTAIRREKRFGPCSGTFFLHS